MAKVIGAWRLASMAFTAVSAAVVAVLVIGPWGWTAGIDVTHGPTITGPAPEPSVELGVLYQSPDSSIVVPDPTTAGKDQTIRFDVAAVARDDHSVEITEDITQSFATERHGVQRDIPLDDGPQCGPAREGIGQHAMRSLEVATDDGTPGDVSLSDGSGFDGVTIRIGDPDTTITGVHRYRLTYVLEDLVSDPSTEVLCDAAGGDLLAVPTSPTDSAPEPETSSSPRDRIALDAFTAWQQAVYGTTYTVRGPDDPVDAGCTQGSEFYRTPCASTLTADGATFEASAPVAAYNGVTVEVDWPEGTFGPAVVHGPERATWPVRALAVALSLGGVVVVAVAAYTRRRALWARTRRGVVATFGGVPEATPSDLVPRSARVDAPIEFVPPMGLRPAELLRLEQGDQADPARLIASTVIDLAASGEIELVAARDDEDWVARWHRGGSHRQLRRYEGRLLVALFPEGQDEVRFGDRTSSMSHSQVRVIEQLDDDMKEGQLLEKRLGSAARGCWGSWLGSIGLYVMLLVIAGVAGAALRAVRWQTAMVLAGVGIALITGLYGLAQVRRAGRDLTTVGFGASYRAEGFRRFFDGSEDMHARAAAEAGLLRQYLGYAVAFDAVDRWVSAFAAPDLTWMGATDVSMVNAWVYGSAVQRASTPPAPVRRGPSSSFGGFGGGGGGGGFGGGSGGGGGGSW